MADAMAEDTRTWEVRRPPLSRGDSSVSARDSRYWLSIASASSSILSAASSSPDTARSGVYYRRTPNNSTTTATSPVGSISASPVKHRVGGLPVSNIRPPPLYQHPPHRLSCTDVVATVETALKDKEKKKQTHRGRLIAEEVYENQRYQMVLGWGSKGHLLPLDPGKYMRAVEVRGADENASRRRESLDEFPRRRNSEGSRASVERSRNDDAVDGGSSMEVDWVHSNVFPDIVLPNVGVDESTDTAGPVAGTPSRRWEWVSPWHLEFPPHFPTDTPADPDGWQYSTSFQNFVTVSTRDRSSGSHRQRSHSHPPNPSLSSCWRPKHYVRRRKWVRLRRLRSSRMTASASHRSPFDDSFLDSMCGWLRKLGHVRKNWKLRYFVLEKSILRYYADESRTRLKGEVLLFHPATRVHYVDIHFSGGRDHCFAIQVGQDYTLLLQAQRLSDRENWMYCIEDALLCRDSYRHDPEQTREAGYSVAQRRKISAESLIYNSEGVNPHRIEMFTLHSQDGLRAVAKNGTVMGILGECDKYLDSKRMTQHMGLFVLKFKQKYAYGGKNIHVHCGGANEEYSRGSSITDFPQELTNVGVLQDARSLLALSSYRFYLERTLEDVMNHLMHLPAHPTRITSPHGSKPTLKSREESQKKQSVATDEEWEMIKKAVVYKLERQTFIPLQDVIYNLLETTVAEEDMELFERNRMYLAVQPQSFFEIADSHVSTSEWKAAIALLNMMDEYSLPTEKAAVILEVAKCIYETHRAEHSEKDQPMMSADDFLPIFICVISRCKLRSVVISRHLVSETMITGMMIGEIGYYTTMFEAAIGYIASYEVGERASQWAYGDGGRHSGS